MELQTDDGYIIHQCLNGDSAAFGILVDRYKAGIYALAYSKLGNFSDAEDAAQETFIKAYRNLSTLRRWDSFHVWLYSITINICRMRLRSKAKRPDREFVEDLKPKALDGPSVDSYREKLVFDSLNEALDSLPDLHRQVLTLHYLGGMNIREVAEALGKSTRTIDRWLQSARSQLREEMLAMMDRTFNQQKLQAVFTLRIVEMIKHIRLTPLSPTKMLPWGLSLATCIVAAFLGISIHLSPMQDSQSDMSQSQLSESKVLNVGEYPVDVMRMSNISVMANSEGNGTGINESILQNALSMAPQAEGGTWTKKADMPTAKCRFASCVVDNKIYAFGGVGAVGAGSSIEQYDPNTDKWEKKAEQWLGEPTADVVDNQVYVFTDWLIQKYDPVDDSWEIIGDMPNQGSKERFQAVALDNKIYIIGGMSAGTAVSSLEEYDPIANKWTKKADMPTPRWWLAACALNGKIYAIGGMRAFAPVTAVEEYDPATDTWITRKALSTATHSLSASATNGKIYAIGGVGFGPILSSVEEYDPVNDTWTKKTNMPTARISLATNVVNDRIYAIGGTSAELNEIPTVEEYIPEATDKGVDFKGKFPTTWGDLRTAMNR